MCECVTVQEISIRWCHLSVQFGNVCILPKFDTENVEKIMKPIVLNCQKLQLFNE